MERRRGRTFEDINLFFRINAFLLFVRILEIEHVEDVFMSLTSRVRRGHQLSLSFFILLGFMLDFTLR